jgi:hypothetical protein
VEIRYHDTDRCALSLSVYVVSLEKSLQKIQPMENSVTPMIRELAREPTNHSLQ